MHPLRKPSYMKRHITGVSQLLGILLLTCSGLSAQAQVASQSPAQSRTEAQFRAVRAQQPQLWAFLKDMPKGGDLHVHLSGAIYAESMIAWAAEDGLCVDEKTLTVVKPPCDPAQGRVAMASAQSSSTLYRRMIDAWSMRNPATWGLSGHDQFFDSFGKFSQANKNGHTGDMLAEVAARASVGKVSYLELMETPGSSELNAVIAKAPWNDDLGAMRDALIKNGLSDAVKAAGNDLRSGMAKQREILKCESAQPGPGCEVAVRFIYQVLRGLPKEVVFAQILTGFELASSDPNVVGLNLVMPEDAMVPMRDFSMHMRFIDFLQKLYPKVQVSLHAGELAPGLVPPDGLRFHIRDSINIGHAKRIGHGVDVMQEDHAVDLLKQMARDKVMVEICLTSNTGILGVSGTHHPLSAYLQYGVPVALATDDEGVSRSEMTAEYVKAVQEQNISYRQLKTMARNSLQYAFVQGASYWQDIDRLRPAAVCAKDKLGAKSISSSCQGYLDANPKAKLQRKLEDDFAQFESKF